MPDGGSYCAVVLTAISVEYEAVLAHLTNVHRDKRGQVIYRRGTFSTSRQSWDVIIRETGFGNVRAAIETLLAIHYFNPILVLFVGVAGFLKDVELGDVVIPSKVYLYESGRANVTAYQTRPQVVNPTFPLVQQAQAEAKDPDWLQRIKGPVSEGIATRQPRVHVAPIASGESVVASTRSPIYKFLRGNFSDAVAVEMESYGFLLAASFHPEVEAVAIRGISDLINKKKRTDLNGFQKLAARHASAFAFELLAKVDVADLRRSRSSTNELDTAIHTDHLTVGVEETFTETMHEPVVKKTSETTEIRESTTITERAEQETVIASTTDTDSQKRVIQQYEDKIRDVYSYFGEGRRTFADQCGRAIQLMNDLESMINRYDENIVILKRHIKLKIVNLIRIINELRIELHNFPHGYTSEKQVPHQKKVRDKFDLLLEYLEQIVKES